MLEYVRDTLRDELAAMAEELARIRALLAEAVRGLATSFERLAVEAETEKQVLETLLVSLGSERAAGGAATQGMDAFVRECAAILKSLAANIELTGARGTEGVARLGDLVGRVDRSMQLLSEFEMISRSTHILALNARIEASRLGAQGAGFAVVATEVKSVAKSSRDLAENIAEHVVTARRSADALQVLMNDVAHNGTAIVRASRSQVDRMLGDLDALAGSVSLGLAKLSAITNDVKTTVAQAIRALQFEDIVGQLAGTVAQRIERVRAVEAALTRGLNGAPLVDVVALLAATKRERQVRNVEQTSMASGSVELF